MKKLLLLISGLLLSSLLFSGIYSGGTGSVGDPYQIGTTDDLFELSSTNSDWNANFIQISDISFNSDETMIDWDGDGTANWDIEDERGFSPIGNSANRFTGEYNGQGYIIENLYIERPYPADVDIGLFGYIQGATIKNLHLSAADVDGYMVTGALVGYSSSGSLIDNCSSSGSISGTETYGGLVGTNSASIIKNSSSSCFISWGDHYNKYKGGLVGKHKDTGALIENCYATGDVRGDYHTHIGGLVGYTYKSTIVQSYSTGDVYCDDYGGGLVGYVNTNTEIVNCFTHSNVDYRNGTRYGAFCGFASFSTIQHCYSVGEISHQSVTFPTGGGFSGQNSNVTFVNNVWNSSTSQTTGDGAIAKSSTEMKDAFTFIDLGWDFCDNGSNIDGIWTIDENGSPQDNDGYPALAWQGLTNSFTPIPPEVNNNTGASDISTNSAILHGEISNTGGETPNVHIYYGDNDAGTGTWDNSIDMGTQNEAFQFNVSNLIPLTTYYYRCYASNSAGNVWASNVESFTTTCHFLGSGTETDPYQIQNVEDLRALSENSVYWDNYFIQTADIDFDDAIPAIIDWNTGTGWSPIGSYSEPFTGVYDGNNNTILNIFIDRNADNQGLFGYSSGAEIKNLNIENPLLIANRYAGGLVGYATNTVITNITVFNVSITGERGIGGLVGFLTGNSEIMQCSAAGETMGNADFDIAYQGGLVGIVENDGGGNIKQSYADVDVATNTGARVSGGLVGLFRGDGIIEDCYALGNAYGRANTGTSATGGLVGRLGDATDNNAIIKNSYAIGQPDIKDGNPSPVLGGLLGYQTPGTQVIDCFWDTEASGETYSAEGTGKTTQEMKDLNTFTNENSTGLNNAWDFASNPYDDILNNDIWGINPNENNSYPFFIWQGFSHVAPPVVSTDTLSTISATSATAIGEILYLGSDNPSQHGICYNTTDNPTLDDSFTNEWSINSTGYFSSDITGLDNCELYYYRAYAINSADTAYGEVLSFTTLDDTQPVPDVISLPDITDECEVTSLTAPTAMDNCAGSITATHDATLPITTQGTTIVTWTYDDGNGNVITQTQNVIINDVSDPVPDVASLPDLTAECEVTTLTAPTATDNCAGVINGTHDATLPINTQGTTTVSWTYDDGNGNIITQTQDVVIDDASDPVPDVISLPDITDECEVTSLTAPTAMDNCAGSITATHDATLPITTQGTTIVTWTYDDGNGNVITQTQDVIIDDVSDPVPDVASLPDITAECEVSTLTAPTATDNCAGIITATHDATLPITTQGTTTLTWTYDDGNGNIITQTQDVVIDDASDPVPDVASLPDVNSECEITTLTVPTATDNCAGSIAATHDATLPITTQGTTLVTWTYNDGNGNIITQTQDVIIDDVTDPVPDLASLPDITDECEITTLTAPTATDNCAGSIAANHDATLPITTQGTTIVTWTYDDGNGNVITQTQNVIINDVSDPVPDVASLPDLTAECEVTTLTAPTATDNCAGGITATHDATLPITTQGTTLVTWTYDDGNGNVITQTQDVIIDDASDPFPDVASLPDVISECEIPTLTAPTATDNCAGSIAANHDATLPITTQGTTIVTWTYDDGNGNIITQTQDVIIDDVSNPVPDVASLPDVIAECEITTLTAPTATDNCAGSISGTHDATLPITTQGTTIVTWTYDDGNGNVITQTQDVVIDDVSDPVPDLASLPDITDECEVTTLTAPTATDNCAGSITGTHDATLPITTQGTTIVTWTYDDGNGNVITQTQDVVIDDVSDPVPDLASLPDVNSECEITTLTVPTATDNCAGSISGTHDATLPINTQGTTTVTWTYDDGSGNIITQTQDVVIDDVSDPVPDVVNLPDLTAECEVTTLTAPTATDNCAANITGTHDATLPITTQGTTLITWTYDDGNGNVITQTQDVIIDDVSDPVPDVTSLPDVIAECEITTLTAPTASDNCAGGITGTHDATLPITTQGTTTVTWTYDDGNGNLITQEQNVIIEDLTNPTITCIENQTINLEEGETYYLVQDQEFDPIEASDNCIVESIENDFNNLATLQDAQLPVGTTTIVWTIIDEAGNENTCSFDVTINDFVGFNDFSNTGISIYPNPTKGIINFDFSGLDVQKITILNSTGKIIMEKTVTNKLSYFDFSNYSSGVYLIHLVSDKEVFTAKIIKE